MPNRILAALALALMASLASPAMASARTFAYVAPTSGVTWAVVLTCFEGVVFILASYAIGLWFYERTCWPLLVSMSTVAFILLAGTPVLADTACPQFVLDGRPPDLVAAPASARELCQSAFANLYDPERRVPVYAAEVLTSASIQAAGKIARGSNFRPDERLKPTERATLRDYRGSRFDRGHLAPAADQPTVLAESESFRLSNMVPQNKADNRGAWAGIEESVRTLAVPRFGGGAVHVVSGPIFDGPVRLLKGRVPVPTRLFKAVYAPDDGQGNTLVVGAWIVKNATDPQTRFVSLDALKAEAGIDPFPSLSPELHAAVALTDGAQKRTGVEAAP